MKIYTKGGDAGETGLYGGSRVAKDHQKICTYGTLDELNCVLGVALADAKGIEPDSPLRKTLLRVQGELFALGAELATPREKKVPGRRIEATDVNQLEAEIDAIEAELAPLKTFILPGGAASSAHLHHARAVSRRAERELIRLHREEPVRAEVLQYVNRLSDFLFVAARFANHRHGVADIAWHG